MVVNYPYPSYDPTDKKSFSYETVVKRWPVILTNVIDRVYQTNHAITMSDTKSDASTTEQLEAKITEGKEIIEKASKLKYEMGRDRPLEPIPEDGGAHIQLYNEEHGRLAEQNKNTWFTAPWLFAECYLYRLMRSWFALTAHWTQFDPFFEQKQESFKSSGVAVGQLAETMSELDPSIRSDLKALNVLFQEMIQMCLWGNATDLSLLPSLSSADIEKLQSVGKAAQAEKGRKYLLTNHGTDVWDHVSQLKGAKVDFVLDNAGFELFTDLVLADFLLTYTSFVSKVTFHGKSIPWFVSDVTAPDFTALFDLLTPQFFTSLPPSSHTPLAKMRDRWSSYLACGTFEFSIKLDSGLDGGPLALRKKAHEGMAFWTRWEGYWELPEGGGKLMDDLKQSGLVIFKGDLNYRKLTGDVRWPHTTPFADAIGPLRGHFPLLSLRTCKADVVVGLDEGVAERLDGEDAAWRVNGKYGLISFAPRGGGDA